MLIRSIKLNTTNRPTFSQKEKAVFLKENKCFNNTNKSETIKEKNAKNLITQIIGIGLSVTTLWILTKYIIYAITNKKLNIK